MASTSDMRVAWGPHCTTGGRLLVTMPVGNQGARITVDSRAVPAFKKLDEIFSRHNYLIRKVDTGAYNCRLITGGTDWSLHAYAIAGDFNWQTNPYGPNLVTDMPPEMIRDIEALRTKRSKKQVFRWGGRYSGNKDAMHFELIVTPAELAEGIEDPNEEEFVGAQADKIERQVELLVKRSVGLKRQVSDRKRQRATLDTTRANLRATKAVLRKLDAAQSDLDAVQESIDTLDALVTEIDAEIDDLSEQAATEEDGEG
jgi:prefoldin subunit 5